MIAKTNSFKVVVFMFLILLNITCNKTNIHEDTPKPVLLVDHLSVIEGESDSLQVGVTLKGTHKDAIIIKYQTIAGTATELEDYTHIFGEMQFQSLDSIEKQFVPIKIIDDDIYEETEKFKIEFSTDDDVKLNIKTSEITIFDNDLEEIIYNYEGYSTPKEYDGWTSVFADEFSGTMLNEEYWNPVIGNGCPSLCGFGNNEKQYYRKENIEIDSGLLTIHALKQEYESNYYTSARLNTKDKIYFFFGRVDIRAKLPYSQGLWPALWMQGQDDNMVGWPERGEIDIMELRGNQPNVVSSTVHYKNASGNHYHPPSKTHTLSQYDYSDEFHVFSIIWNKYKIEFFVDDERYNVVFFSSQNFYQGNNPFLEPFYILMNVAVGGNFGGDPDTTTIWPQKMEVDYVRVFQKNN